MSENQIKLAYGTAKVGDYVLIVIDNYMKHSTTITSGRIHNDGYVYDVTNSKHRAQNSNIMICKLDPSVVSNVDKEIINKFIKDADDKKANSDTIAKYYIYKATLTIPESVAVAGELRDMAIEVRYKDIVKIKKDTVMPEIIDDVALHKARMAAIRHINPNICHEFVIKHIDAYCSPYDISHMNKEKIKAAIDSFDWWQNLSIQEIDEFKYTHIAGAAKQIYVDSKWV